MYEILVAQTGTAHNQRHTVKNRRIRILSVAILHQAKPSLVSDHRRNNVDTHKILTSVINSASITNGMQFKWSKS